MQDTINLASVLEHNLPYLRRYARALTGSQQTGDRYAIAALETLSADREMFDKRLAPRVALFKVFHRVWSAADPMTRITMGEDRGDSLEARAQRRLAALTPNAREAVLLRVLEGFDNDETSQILGLDPDATRALTGTGLAEMRNEVTGRVLIIEDEPIIAMDIESIILGMGHAVVGIARTEAEASGLSSEQDFDIVLADINLADGSSGIDAVRGILGDKGGLPVIFITAYPERLLTGERPEPAFLITKPFDEEQVRSAVSHALFFSTTKFLQDSDGG